MLGRNKRYIQVQVTDLTYKYLKKYSQMFGTSLSAFCSDAVTEKILKNGVLSDSEIRKEANFINKTYEDNKIPRVIL